MPYTAGCCFESGVATEAVSRASFFPRVAAQLETATAARPKLIELTLDGRAELYPAPALTAEGAGPRMKRITEQLRTAHFTGRGDRQVVRKIFRTFAFKLNVSSLR